MFGKSVCILISGKAGTGKSTSAEILKNLLSFNYLLTIANFANGVKNVATKEFGWDGVKDERGRRLLQEVGRVGRNYNPDLWVNKTVNNYVPSMRGYPFDFVIVDDWRFPNEENFIRKDSLYSVYTIRIEAKNRESLQGSETYNDISETSLDNHLFDYVIDNTGSMEDLEKQLLEMIEFVIKREEIFNKELNK